MIKRIDLRSINHSVLVRQHLAGGTTTSQLSQMVLDLGGLQADNPITPYLSLAARLPDFVPKELENQLFNESDMALIRCVRKSIYVHNKDLLPVMYAATSDKVIKSSEHFMFYRGVPLSEYTALSDSILQLLKERRQTKAEIKETLATDFDVSAVLDYMSDQGLLVRSKPASGWKDGAYRYAIFSDVFPDIQLGALEEREAIHVLVRHYLEAFGPASLNDINWWTGLGNIRVRSALRALGDEVLEIRTSETNIPMMMLASGLDQLRSSLTTQSPTVTLLPANDPYLMGYCDRHRYVDFHHYEYIVDDSGNCTNVILVNGRAAGTWDCPLDNKEDFKVHLFDYQLAAVSELVRVRAKRLGKLLTGRDVRIGQIDRMAPLSKQPAGAFMSPLKENEF